MVTRGQFLERPTVIPVGSGVLEGLWHRGAKRPAVLIVPPPPGEGGMDHVLAAELAWAVSQAGHPELRFNFRGVGASQGQRGARASRQQDAEAALQVVEENTRSAAIVIAALGGSCQLGLELAAAHGGLAGLALVYPAGCAWTDIARLGLPVLVQLPEADREPLGPASEAVLEAGGMLEIIEAADRTYRRGLPQVGRSFVQWLGTLTTTS